MKYVTILASLFAFGCATSGVFPIDYRFIDYPAELRIELAYENDTGHSVCLLPESWPNKAGKINQASAYMALEIDGTRFPVVDFNTGYCSESDGCAIHVLPGEITTVSIPYSDFGVPRELSAKPKNLVFSTVGVRCPRNR